MFVALICKPMTNEEIFEARILEDAISKIIEGLSVTQQIGNVEFHIQAHQHPGMPSDGRNSSRTGYGFNLYLDYFEKGNAGKRNVIINRDFNAKRPGSTIYEHIPYDNYLKSLAYIFKELHRRFDLNKISPHLGDAYTAIIAGLFETKTIN
jgi:hypothetical protein